MYSQNEGSNLNSMAEILQKNGWSAVVKRAQK